MSNYNWSDPETTGPFVFSNKFGEVILYPVTEFMSISKIDNSTLPAINEVLISLEHAEQVTLITENRKAYMSICFPLTSEDKAAFALRYSCRNRAAVCRVSINQFRTAGNISAQQQIDDIYRGIHR